VKRRILASLLVIAVVAGLVGASTWAYFSDVETSEDNTFTAGTLDLVLSDDNETDQDGVTATWVSPGNWAPGEEVAATLRMKNVGSIGSVNLFLKPTELVESDTIADWINITDFTITFKDAGDNVVYGYGNWAGDDGWMSKSPWSPWSTDPPLTLREFYNGPYKVWVFGRPPGTLPASENVLEANGAVVVELDMTFQFEPSTPNQYQGDNATMTFRVLTFNGPVEGGTIIWEGSSGYGYGNLTE